MNGRPLTDVRISQALSVHLPQGAPAGLRERILDAADTTKQQRALPSFLGALSEADPVARRRSLLIAAALLVALAFASAAAVGALRQLQRDPVDELSLEPPADLPAFVLSSYERLPQLPPVAFTWHDSDSDKGRVYVDRSGTVRFDRFTSADATQPSGYTIINENHRISGMALVESDAVWVEQGHEAFDVDPRVLLKAILGAGGGPGCEMARDPSDVGNGITATGWRYVGAESVAGRPTHHVVCVGEHSLDIDLWLDDETRLILRTREPLTDDTGQPIADQFATIEVTEIAFGEQPASLFEPPEGVTRMSPDAYGAYICTRGLPNELIFELFGLSEGCPTPTEAEAAPLPTPTPTIRPSLAPRPSGPAGPLVWTPASLKEDWPAPVRPEPAGGASVQPMPLSYVDPTGDTGSDLDPWVDIRAVTADTVDVRLELVSNQPPLVDPAEQWIAYGVVTDDDRDGVPDWRYGIDNSTVGTAEASGDPPPTRWWRTDLHTGRTDAGGMDVPGSLGWFTAEFKSVYPSGSDASFRFGGAYETTQGSVPWGIKLDIPFYAWSSVIVNGRVVATDYAPDAGWLIATSDAKPGDIATPDTPPAATNLPQDPFPVRISMTVPDGWTAVEHRRQRFDHAGGMTRDDGMTGLRWVMVDNLARDECAGRAGAIDGRATIDDLVAFLARLPLIDISKNTDVTLDGYRGKYLEFTRTAGQIDCGWGGLDGWPANSPSARDEVDRVWILDVEGAPLVIDAFTPPGSSDGVRAELRQIVDSIQIEP